jgi:hypothetical protein
MTTEANQDVLGRQAGNSNAEIEVTPRMVAAGLDALRQLVAEESIFAGHTEEEVVTKVLAGMSAASPAKAL